MSFGPIQMLDVLVDPTVDNLLTDDGIDGQTPPGDPGSTGGGLDDEGGVADPRNPGHFVRRGGSGSPRRRVPRIPPPHSTDIHFVQKKTINVPDTGVVNRVDHITFNAPVKKDSLIVVCAYSPGAATVAISDDRSGGSNTYTTAKELNDGSVLMRMSWAQAIDPDQLTIAVAWSRGALAVFPSLIVILEYSGVFTGGGNAPVEDTAFVSQEIDGFPAGSFTTTMPDLNTSGAPPGRLALAMWDVNLLSPAGGNATCGPTNNPATGFIIRGQINDALGSSPNPADYVFVTEGLPITTGNVGPTLSFDLDGSDFSLFASAIGASFKRT